MLPAPKLITTSVFIAATVSASASRSTMRQGTVRRRAIICESTPGIGSSRAG